MTREGVITKGTTIGNGKSANPGDIVSLPVDVFTKLAMTKDIRPITDADRKKQLATKTK